MNLKRDWERRQKDDLVQMCGAPSEEPTIVGIHEAFVKGKPVGTYHNWLQYPNPWAFSSKNKPQTLIFHFFFGKNLSPRY